MKKYLLIIIVFTSVCSCKFSKPEVEKVNTITDTIKEIKIDTVSIVKKENICINSGSDLSKFIFSIDDQYYNEYYQYWDEIIPFFNNAQKHTEEALYLLSCSNLSEYQKRNLIEIMNGLPFEKNIEFRNKCYIFYEKNQISKKTLTYILFNNFNNRYFLHKYYENPGVVKLLNKIKKDSVFTTSRKKHVNEILNGKALEKLIWRRSQPNAPELDLDAW